MCRARLKAAVEVSVRLAENVGGEHPQELRHNVMDTHHPQSLLSHGARVSRHPERVGVVPGQSVDFAVLPVGTHLK